MAPKYDCLQVSEIKRFSDAVDDSIKDRRYLSERQTKIESNYISMGEQMKEMNDKIAQILKKLDGMNEKYDERYASKLTERIVYACIGIIATTVIVALIGLVVTSPK